MLLNGKCENRELNTVLLELYGLFCRINFGMIFNLSFESLRRVSIDLRHRLVDKKSIKIGFRNFGYPVLRYIYYYEESKYAMNKANNKNTSVLR